MNYVKTEPTIGRIGRIETSFTPTGKQVTKGSFAVDAGKDSSGQKQTTWLNFTAWEKTSEFMQKYLEKGNRVLFVGTIPLEPRVWVNQAGVAMCNHEITVYNVTPIDWAENGGTAKTADVEVDVDEDEFPF